MSKIKKIETEIEGLYIVEPDMFNDNRENVLETYNESEYFANGLCSKFVQDNESFSKKGVLRGMHINTKHPQSKLIRVLDGEILDVVIDLRKESKTYLKTFSIVLSESNNIQLYIPEGMGHGYLALTDVRVLFKSSTHYIPGDELGFAWNSKVLMINWGTSNPILSERDKKSKDLSEVWK